MKVIIFFVPGAPRGKERPRTGAGGHVYTPKKTKMYERLIRDYYHREAGNYRFPAGTAIYLNVKAVYPIPKSWNRAKKAAAAAGELVPGKPDGDNILKVVADALNGEGYDDDRNIYRMTVTKEYGLPEDEGLLVILSERPVN